jgi:hypothetical protein
MTRRQLLKSVGLSAAAALSSTAGQGAENAGGPGSSRPQMRLGLVTYNLAKDWTIETIIKNCEATAFAGVELRTTHAHGVEVNLSKAERAEVKKRFRDSKVELMGLARKFHT